MLLLLITASVFVVTTSSQLSTTTNTGNSNVPLLQFLARDSIYTLSALCAIAILPVRPGDQSKTVKVRIMQFLPYSIAILLAFTG